jgi:spore germination cell wall hydrolase CwlJ-like protein
MAKVRIIRGRNRKAGPMPRLYNLLSLAVVALVASCVMPLAASRGPASTLSVALDSAQPFSSTEDIATLLAVTAEPTQPDAAMMAEAAMAGAGTGAMSPSPDGNLPATPFALPAIFNTGPAATPYVFRGRTSLDNLRAQLCLTAAIYYEGANEPDDGQRAIAQVVLNRVRHPAWPNTVCDVVYQGTERNDTLCQFTFGCDGALARLPSASGWARARRVSQVALAGYVFAPAGLATFYHTKAVNPIWNKALSVTGVFGAHIFYRLPGGAGEPKAFFASYRGSEPQPGPHAKLYMPPAPMAPYVGATPMPYPIVPVPMTSLDLQAMPRNNAQVAAIAPTRSVAADRRYVPNALPESDIRAEYQNSGQWIGK